MKTAHYPELDLTHIVSTHNEYLYNKGHVDWTTGPRLEHLYNIVMKRLLFRELVHAWSERKNLSGLAAVEAHGLDSDVEWQYWPTDTEQLPVQQLVNELDGVFAAVLLLMCNPYNAEITSKSTIIFHPNCDFYFPQVVNHSELIRAFIPGEGYLERKYKKLRRLVNKLK